MASDRIYLPYIHPLTSDRSHSRRVNIGRLEIKTMGLFLSIFVFLSVVSLLYLTQASRMTAVGYKIQKGEKVRADLDRDNAQLRFDIAELGTLTNIKRRAEVLGLGPVDATQIKYLFLTDYRSEQIPSPEPSITPAARDDEVSLPSTDDVHGIPFGWWGELIARFASR